MMTNQEYSDQALKQLFKKLPQEQFPDHLNTGIMEHIHKAEKRRQHRYSLLLGSSVCLVCGGMILAVIGTCHYFFTDLFQTLRNIFAFESSGTDTLNIHILTGIVFIILLLADFLLRQLYRRS